MAHGPIHELHLAAASFKFFNQQHLMDIVASESVRGRDDDAIKDGSSHLLSEPIEAWSGQFCSAVSIIAKGVLLLPRPSLGFMIGAHTVELLFDGLCLCLSLCRNAHV